MGSGSRATTTSTTTIGLQQVGLAEDLLGCQAHHARLTLAAALHQVRVGVRVRVRSRVRVGG